MQQDNETRKAIMKGQCLNIAFQEFNTNAIRQKELNREQEIKLRIEVAHDIYNELMKQNFLSW